LRQRSPIRQFQFTLTQKGVPGRKWHAKSRWTGGVLGVLDLGNTRRWTLIAVVSAGCTGSLNPSGRVGEDIHPSPCLISTVRLQTAEAKSWTESNVTWTCSYKVLSTVTLLVASRTFCALPIRRCWARRAFRTQSRRTYWKQLFPQIPFNTLHDNECVSSLLKSAQEPERNYNACMMLDTIATVRSNWVTRPQHRFCILTQMGT